MYNIVKEFLKKFNLEYNGSPRQLDRKEYEFRMKFLQEEFNEYKESYSFYNLEGQLDALVDIIYITLGIAARQGFNIEEAFKRIHKTNMKKERCLNLKTSKRNSLLDIIKPEGWEPPDLKDLVK